MVEALIYIGFACLVAGAVLMVDGSRRQSREREAAEIMRRMRLEHEARASSSHASGTAHTPR